MVGIDRVALAQAANYRFFGTVKEITKAMLVRYCHIDYDSEIALVAVRRTPEPLMLGVASFAVKGLTSTRRSSPSSCATTSSTRGWAPP